MSSDEELAAFVPVRLDEEEAAAKRAAAETADAWFTGTSEEPDERSICYAGPSTLHPGSTWDYRIVGGVPLATAGHIARHDPARALREVASRRQRLALYLDAREALAAALENAPPLDDPATAHSYVRERINVNQASGRFAAFEMSVRLDATTWSDHPAYQRRWAPATG